MERLGVQKASDEELLAFVENDACGTDAIQVVTGCTFGKGNFIFNNYGKHAFTLVARKRGKALRVCLRPDAIETNLEHFSLFERVRNEEASPEEIARFRQLHQERAQAILDADPEFLFKIEAASTDIPPKAMVTSSAACDLCGEQTKIDLLHEIDGRMVCVPCRRKRNERANCFDV